MFDEVTSKGTHRRGWLSIKRKEIRPTELKPFQNIIVNKNHQSFERSRVKVRFFKSHLQKPVTLLKLLKHAYE